MGYSLLCICARFTMLRLHCMFCGMSSFLQTEMNPASLNIPLQWPCVFTLVCRGVLAHVCGGQRSTLGVFIALRFIFLLLLFVSFFVFAIYLFIHSLYITIAAPSHQYSLHIAPIHDPAPPPTPFSSEEGEVPPGY